MSVVNVDDVVPKIKLPKMKFGIWEVTTFKVDDNAADQFNISQWEQGIPDRGIVPGTYTSLIFKDESGERHVMMSDTPAERKDHVPAVVHCEPGSTWIIMGFGLGVLVNALMRAGAGHLTVIEMDEGIIENIVPIYLKKFGDRLLVLHADALKWKPPKGAKWDCAWHDIWPTISEDNLPEIATLKRRYARRVKWQGAWAEQLARDMRSGALERRESRIPAFLMDEWMLKRIARNAREMALKVYYY